MKYRVLAKAFLFIKGSQNDIAEAGVICEAVSC